MITFIRRIFGLCTHDHTTFIEARNDIRQGHYGEHITTHVYHCEKCEKQLIKEIY